jgi:mannose-6-phosphate isomerase
MNNTLLYPLIFEPIYQYRLWGGRRLANLLCKPLPDNDEPVGEAWLLSDREDKQTLVANGPLAGYTIAKLLQEFPVQMMGKRAKHFNRFPLLLKFLDCKEVLSVQVHPSDSEKKYLPEGDTGKTEAWIILEVTPGSHIYAGLKPGTNANNLREAIANHKVADKLHSFIPKVGDGVFIQSGTVHTLGGAVVFEVQENSDTTFRLFDWDRIDAKTGKPRKLQVDEAIACIDFNQVDIGPVVPLKDAQHQDTNEQLFNCGHFAVWRNKSNSSFEVGAKDEPQILVCIEGEGMLDSNGNSYSISKGDVMLLPAIIGKCVFQPQGDVNLLEISIPDINN